MPKVEPVSDRSSRPEFWNFRDDNGTVGFSAKGMITSLVHVTYMTSFLLSWLSVSGGIFGRIVREPVTPPGILVLEDGEALST